ncbi:hypothetical protein P4S70_20135 [Enterovibrio sp. Hal110]
MYFSDSNFDGYPELFYEGKIYQNNNGTLSTAGTINPYVNQDTNSRDSTSTYVNQDTNIKYSTGKDRLQFIDVDGDGARDTIVTPKNGEATIHFGKPWTKDKITTINEAGVSYSVQYTFSTKSSVLKQVHHFDYPYMNTTPRRYLVSGYSKSPKGYSPTSYSYFYEGARSHAKGYGFLGFQKSRVPKTRRLPHKSPRPMR